MVVTTRRPSGDTWDMNPSRSWLPNSPRKLVHEITSSLRMVMRFCTGTLVYRLLSFSGPSRSIPKVLPAPEKEWQLAQVCMSSSSTRLRVSAASRRRHAISGTAREGAGVQRFDDAVFLFRRHEGHVAVEDGR